MFWLSDRILSAMFEYKTMRMFLIMLCTLFYKWYWLCDVRLMKERKSDGLSICCVRLIRYHLAHLPHEIDSMLQCIYFVLNTFSALYSFLSFSRWTIPTPDGNLSHMCAKSINSNTLKMVWSIFFLFITVFTSCH